MIAPRARPPITSVKNSVPTESNVMSAPVVFTPSKVKNTTTPIPSLNKDSPAILVSVRGDNFIFLIIDNTAIGSVGAINEPKRRQSK